MVWGWGPSDCQYVSERASTIRATPAPALADVTSHEQERVRCCSGRPAAS